MATLAKDMMMKKIETIKFLKLMCVHDTIVAAQPCANRPIWPFAHMPAVGLLPGHTFSMHESPVRRAKKPCYLCDWTHSLTVKRIRKQLALQYFWVSYITNWHSDPILHYDA